MRGSDVQRLCEERRWSRARLVLELRNAARVQGQTLPADDSLKRMIRQWVCGDRGLSETYAGLLSDTFGVQFEPVVVTQERSDLGADGDLADGHRMRVAIAVVIRGADVLLVQRRSDDSPDWQFPAGMIKPESTSVITAVKETAAETGVRSRVFRNLGSRVHPATGVLCEYVLCEYLVGEAQNLDVAENIDVVWSPISSLGKFVATERIFPPVLTALEEVLAAAAA